VGGGGRGVRPFWSTTADDTRGLPPIPGGLALGGQARASHRRAIPAEPRPPLFAPSPRQLYFRTRPVTFIKDVGLNPIPPQISRAHGACACGNTFRERGPPLPADPRRNLRSLHPYFTGKQKLMGHPPVA